MALLHLETTSKIELAINKHEELWLLGLTHLTGRRAGTLDIDLMPNQPGGGRCDRLCSGVVSEERWKMFEGRAAQVALILLLSTDEARG